MSNIFKLSQYKVATKSAAMDMLAKNQFFLHCSYKLVIPPNQVKINLPDLHCSMQNKLIP